MTRTAWLLLPWLILLGVAAGLLLAETGHHVFPAHTVSTGVARIGGPFQLMDQDGVARRDSDFRGRYLLIYFGYSHCPDVCPTTLSDIAGAYDRLGARKTKVVPVFVTLDPGRDTPKVIKTYLAAFGPEFVGLTGTDDAIARVANEYRASYRVRALPEGGYALDHSSAIYLMGPDGRFIAFYEDEAGPGTLAADLRKKIPG
jgi:protein SCO1/2